MQRVRKIKNVERRRLRERKPAKIQQEDNTSGIETHPFNQQWQAKLIYGTNIVVDQAKQDLQTFVWSYQKPPIDSTSPPQRPYWNNLIKFQDIQDPQVIFEVSGKDIFHFNEKLYYQFIYYPCEMFQIFDEAIKQSLLQLYSCEQNFQKIKKKAEHLITSIIYLRDQQVIKIHNLLPKYINRLISVNALVTRVSQVIPDLHVACFQCEFCQNYQRVRVQNARATTPSFCKQCNRQNTMQINHNLSSFIDKQYIKIQQLPDQLEQGSTPIVIQAIAYQDNVDKIKSGDCIQIIGIYRATPVFVKASRNQHKSVFKTHIDILSLRIDGEFSKISMMNNSFSDEDKRKFYKLADSPQITKNLIHSFAPSIIENDIVKLGLLAQIFGGTPKLPFSNRSHFRSDINVCLIGDPSTAKSQLLKQVHKITTRSMMVCGSGSSSSGLTVTIKKDPQTRQFVVQGGALVMSDGGICCIDQFDKIGSNSQTALLEAMEQQTISVAKAGIVCQLKARTSLLVAANPIKSKYDRNKSVVENINLPPALLSRFDLIYILLDIPNKLQDLKIANHIMSMYSLPNQVNNSPIPHKQLLRYIAFARDYIHPTISQQIGKIIGDKYCQMRKEGISKKVISSTPRQLQSIIRLSEAFAKMRLSQRVQKIDVDQAVKIIYAATLKAATDPQTGKIDIGIITTGKSESKREEEEYIGRVVKQFLLANVSTYRKPTYVYQLQEKFTERQKIQVSKDFFICILRKIQAEDFIVIFGEDPKKLQFKLHKNFEFCPS